MFAQNGDKETLFAVSDTIFDTGGTDNILYRFYVGDQSSDWYTCDSVITSAEKIAEEKEFISLSKHTAWYGCEFVQVAIVDTTNTDTIFSKRFNMNDMQGACSVIIVPDSVNADTLLYNNSLIWGN